MKKTFVLSICIFLILKGSNVQSQREKTINQISKIILVTSPKPLKTKILNAQGLRCDWYKNNVKLITKAYKTAIDTITNQYYFKHDALIFVGIVESQYEEINGKQALTQRFSGGYYFKNNKVIHQTSNGHNRFESDEHDPEKELVQEAKKYIKQFSK